MGKENFIPLSQANNSNLCEGRLRVNLPLPYGLGERIEINPHRMDVLRQMAGFSRINLLRDDEPGTSQVIPQIDGINMDGTATARKTKIKTVSEINSELKNDEMCFCNRANWPELNIKLNIGETQQRLMEKRGVNINNQKPWSISLNRIITNRITRDGLSHLLKMNYDNAIETVMFYVIGIPPIIVTQGSTYSTVFLLASKFVFDGIYSSLMGTEKRDRGYRMLVTLGPEIERAIGLSVYSRIGSVIRAKAEEKK